MFLSSVIQPSSKSVTGSSGYFHIDIYISGGSRISRRGAWTSYGGGRGPPRRLRFENFACQNERILTRRGARAGRAPLDPPMYISVKSHLGFYITIFRMGIQLLDSAQFYSSFQLMFLWFPRKDVEFHS